MRGSRARPAANDPIVVGGCRAAPVQVFTQALQATVRGVDPLTVDVMLAVERSLQCLAHDITRVPEGALRQFIDGILQELDVLAGNDAVTIIVRDRQRVLSTC